MYSPFSLTWLMTNNFQVEFFSFTYQKQWKLSVCKKVINQVRVNGLQTTAKFYFLSVTGYAKNITVIETINYPEVQLVLSCKNIPIGHQIFTLAKILHVSSNEFS